MNTYLEVPTVTCCYMFQSAALAMSFKMINTSSFRVCVCVRCCALQADSEQLKQAWLSALQGSIDLAYRERSDSQLTQAGVL